MKKRIIIGCLLIAQLLLTGCGNWNDSVVNDINPDVTFQPVSNSFHYDQLNEEEVQVYEAILALGKTFKGGVIELEEPISANSWLRILHTVNYDYEKRFWPLVTLYVEEEDGISIDELSDEKTISKLYVQLNNPTKNEDIKAFHRKFSDDGSLLNEEEFISLLEDTTLTEEYFLEKTKQIEAVEQEIIAGMPKDIGQKDAVAYFCNWLKDNMEYDIGLYKTYADMTADGTLVPNEYGNASYRNCILQETAVCGGFATIITDLCNQVGIPAYVVTGTVIVNGEASQHGWVALEIGGQTLYMDPTYAVSMNRVDYFCTREQMKARSDGRRYIFSEVFEY